MLPLTRNRSRSRFFSTGASAPPPPSNAWDVAYTVYANKSFSVAAQETTPNGVFFKPDGTKMYIIGSSGDDVNEYDLSTPWDVSSAAYLQNFSVASQTSIPTGIAFNPDGTKMYATSNVSPSSILEYSLNSAWDISTASYVQSLDISAQESSAHSVTFKPDGAKMYVVGTSGNDVNEYSLSTPWDISTATFTVATFSFTAQGANLCRGLYFKPDGLIFFIIDQTLDSVLQYDIV